MEKAELDVVALEILAEAGKVRPWRAQALAKLLAEVEAISIDEWRVRVRKALELRDDHVDNAYFKSRLTRQQLIVAALSGAVLLGALLAVWRWRPPDLTALPRPGFGTLLLVVLMGALGATLSTLRGLAQMTSEGTIPERVGNRVLTALRPLVGAVGAVALYALFDSGLIALGNASLGVLLGGAFAAGFSERLVTGLLEKIQ